MSKFPNPPPVRQLARIRPSYKPLRAGTLLWRVYFRRGRHPSQWNTYRYFGPTTARFDHHLPDPAGQPQSQKRAIHYTACDGITALAEVFQNSRVIDRNAKGPWLVAYKVAGPLTLLDLRGAFTTRAGASMVINSGPRARARRWSQAFHQAYDQIHGLYYSSSMHANQPCVVLYERAQSVAVPAQPMFHRALRDPTILGLLRQAAQQLGYGLV